MDTTPASHTDLFPPELMHLIGTAQRVIDRHVDDYGRCAECRLTWPCQSARQADFVLAAL